MTSAILLEDFELSTQIMAFDLWAGTYECWSNFEQRPPICEIRNPKLTPSQNLGYMNTPVREDNWGGPTRVARNFVSKNSETTSISCWTCALSGLWTLWLVLCFIWAMNSMTGFVPSLCIMLFRDSYLSMNHLAPPPTPFKFCAKDKRN